MRIRPFNAAWWFVLLTAAAGCVFVWALRRKRGDNEIFTALFGLALILYWTAYKVMLAFCEGYPFIFWNELPFHMCNVAMLLSVPAALWKDSAFGRVLKGFCFYGGSLSALLAMAMPVSEFADIPLFSSMAIGFYGFHGALFVLTVSFCTLGVYKPRRRDIPGVLALLTGLGLLAHGLNMILRISVYPEANYFFTYGIPGNPITDALQKTIPIPFVWMLPLLLPVGILWCVLTFFIERLHSRKKGRHQPN